MSTVDKSSFKDQIVGACYLVMRYDSVRIGVLCVIVVCLLASGR